MTTRTITFHTGRTVPYTWRRSPRAKHVGLRISHASGLQVTIPHGVTLERVEAVLQAKHAWIVRHLDRLATLPPSTPPLTAPLPEFIELPALGERWSVTYQAHPAAGVTLRECTVGALHLSGAVEQEELCRQVLRRWLGVRAQATLLPLLHELAVAGGFRYQRGQIRGQRSRWGSCSARGTISLNWHLLFLAPEQVRYVLCHELCHTIELNHSPRFWALLQQHQPDSDTLRRSMRRAWSALPAWLQEGRQPQRID